MNKFKPKMKVCFDNYHIKVNIDGPTSLPGNPEKTHKLWVNRLKDVKVEIDRHVDNLENVHICWRSQSLCVYCGYDPEPHIVTGEPVCCNPAIKEYKNFKESEAS